MSSLWTFLEQPFHQSGKVSRLSVNQVEGGRVKVPVLSLWTFLEQPLGAHLVGCHHVSQMQIVQVDQSYRGRTMLQLQEALHDEVQEVACQVPRMPGQTFLRLQLFVLRIQVGLRGSSVEGVSGMWVEQQTGMVQR